MDFGASIYTACFSGYRGDKFSFPLEEDSPELRRLQSELMQAVFAAAGDGYTSFYCGAAWGFDILAGEAVLAASRDFPSLRLLCAVPYAGQANSFSDAWRRRYNALLARAQDTQILRQNYTRDCYMARNRHMVDRSSLLICYFDGKPGGTAATVSYARKKGLTVVNLCRYYERERIE